MIGFGGNTMRIILLIFTILIFINAKCFSYCFCGDVGGKKSQFFEKYKCPIFLKKKLDNIFMNLSSFTKGLFGGNICKDKDFYVKSLNNDGFEVYNLRMEGLKHCVLRHKNLPQYFIKIGFSKESNKANIRRVMVADLINFFIDFTQTNLFGKVKKMLYHVPGKNMIENDFNYVVISQRIEGVPLAKFIGVAPYSHFDCEKKKQVFRFLERDEFSKILKFFLGKILDYAAHNIIYNESEKKAYIIDTEPLFDTTKEDSISLSLLNYITGNS
jgi:hypothetical protein